MFDPAMMGASAPAPKSTEQVLSEIQRLLNDLATADGSDVDEIEAAKIAKIVAQVADLGANRAKEQQAALGGGPATKFIGRTLGAV